MSYPAPDRACWAVIGASGFVGSAVASAARSCGIEVREVPAPRLHTFATDVAGLLGEARTHDVVAVLADVLKGCEVVINAAGLATPGASESGALRGANTLLPAVLALAARAGGASRFIQLSSAAVQGNRRVLDESPEVAPFSAYSRSKARGEQVLTALSSSRGGTDAVPEICILRATSVQGANRPTTARLVAFARSPLASVAAPGTARTPVVSVAALAELVVTLASHSGSIPGIVLQPWEGMTVRSVLECAGGKPVVLPAWFCRFAVRSGFALSTVLGGRLHGAVRRVELLWFGQRQEPGWAESQQWTPAMAGTTGIRDVLARTPGSRGQA